MKIIFTKLSIVAILLSAGIKSNAQTLFGPETFDGTYYTYDFCSNSITALFPWMYCTLSSPNGKWTFPTTGACTNTGGVAYVNATASSGAGSLLRTPEFDASGQTNITVSFDMTNSYNATYAGDNIYLKPIGWYYDGTYYNSQSNSIPYQYVYLDHARNCENVQLTFNVSTLSYKDHCDFLFWSSATGSSHNFSVILDNFTVTAGGPTGTHEIVKKEQIEIFPNPVQDNLIVKLKDDIKADAILIRDVFGQHVKTPISQINGQNASQIDLSGLAAGLYFVEVLGEQGRWTSKFVKE